jgi:putative transposase
MKKPPPGTGGFQPARIEDMPVENRRSQGWRSRGYLPHFDGELVQQVVSWHLADSLPVDVAERLAAAADDAETRTHYEAYLDAGHGSCALRDPVCADIVQDALLHFDGERYRLLAWVVMPNHVHVLAEPMSGHGLADIMHSWKRHTALLINRHLGQSGPLWRREYWDRYIRDELHYAAAVAYIEHNPVQAGLVATAADWPWSSARFEPVGNRRSQESPRLMSGTLSVEALATAEAVVP